MKITTLHATNFLSINALEVAIDKPITLFAGPNASGKSSVYEGVIFALTGRPHRVALKKQWASLIREGESTATFTLTADEGTFSVQLFNNGEHRAPEHDKYVSTIADCCLEARQITTLAPDDLADVIYRLSPDDLGPEDICSIIAETGISKQYTDSLLPLLRGGFDAAAKEAEIKAREGRAAWSAMTGERYGNRKAGTWIPKTQKAPEIEPLETAARNAQARLSAARDGVSQIYSCPVCDNNVALHEGELILAADLPEITAEADVASLEAFAETTSKAVADAYRAKTLAEQSERITVDARAVHKDIEVWARIKELLSPHGIPLELYRRAIAPINDTLESFSEYMMGRATLVEDGMFSYNDRPRALCSESEQWLCDALFSMAIASMTDYRLIALDRFDLLQPSKRPMFLSMCQAMADAQELQILLFATLKAPFENKSVQCVWLGEQ